MGMRWTGRSSLHNSHWRQRVAVLDIWRWGSGGQFFIKYSILKENLAFGGFRNGIRDSRPFHFHSTDGEPCLEDLKVKFVIILDDE